MCWKRFGITGNSGNLSPDGMALRLSPEEMAGNPVKALQKYEILI